MTLRSVGSRYSSTSRGASTYDTTLVKKLVIDCAASCGAASGGGGQFLSTVICMRRAKRGLLCIDCPISVVVAVMDRQLTQVGVGEFAATAAADPRIDLESLFSVAWLALFGVAARFRHYPVQLARVARCHAAPLISDRYLATSRLPLDYPSDRDS